MRVGIFAATALAASMAVPAAWAQVVTTQGPAGPGQTLPGASQPASSVQGSATPQQSAAGRAGGTVGGTTGSNEVGEVIVTAQRRSENLERTPVAISVVSGASLLRQGITSQSDLQTAVPGLLVKASSNSNMLTFALRGQSTDPFGSIKPGVLPYLNEVQVDSAGGSALYDLQSVQVLKGPQGTLFGRNDTGGAVLFTTAAPTNTFGGYVDARGGNYNLLHLEGAVNIPLIADKALLRVSGVYENRDGYQFNLFDNNTVGDVRRSGARVSLTLHPTKKLTNETVIDFARSGGSGLAAVVFNEAPNSYTGSGIPANTLFSPALDTIFGPGAFAQYLALHPQVQAYPLGIQQFAALQKQRGPYLIDVNNPNSHSSDNFVLTNITKYNLTDDIQIKNVFGYTDLRTSDASDFDGTPYDSDNNTARGHNINSESYSEELQLLGKGFERRLNYIVGAYTSKQDTGESFEASDVEVLPFIKPFVPFFDGETHDNSYALYAQGTYDLSDLTGIRGLGFTAGGRYTIETIEFARRPGDIYFQNPQPVYNQDQTVTFDEPSWQVGLQEQLNSNLLLYVVSRHSFRAGGFNFYAPPIPGPGADGGSGFGPEKATDVEGGAKYSGRLVQMPVRANLAIYNTWIDNAQRITFIDIGGSPSGVTVGVPKAEVTGAEFDGTISPVHWLNFGAELNYTDGRFTSNLVRVNGAPPVAFGPYADTPRYSGDLYGEATLPLRDSVSMIFHADVYGQSKFAFSASEETINPGAIIPGYVLANFRVTIQDDVHGWSVSANVKNAFNKTYFVGGVGDTALLDNNNATPGEPRVILVDVRKSF